MSKVALVAVIAGLTFVGVADAKTIGRQGARGDYAIAIASGSVDHPHWIKVRIKSHPHQRVTGNYTAVCSRGFGAGSKSGKFHGHGNFTRRIRLPGSHPDNCTASAAASLARSGPIKVILKAG